MMSRLERRLAEQNQTRKHHTGLIIVLAVLLVASAGAAYLWFGGNFEKARHTGGPVGPNKVNILVLGVDERSDDVGRSDTLFVVTIDTNSKSVSLLSIPRDTRVKIPGHGWDKINHAYAEGGYKLSQKAVENLLGIPIDYYIGINFAGFYKIVDALGGVDVNVEKRMHYEDPYDNLVIDLQPGMQHMDGKTAIQYVRYRDEEGDIGRVARQQKFMKAMLKEAVNPMVITRVPAIIREVNSVIKTDMSTGEMLNLAKLLNDANQQGLKTDMVPGKPAYIDDISYWLPDIMALREHMAQNLGLVMNDKYRTDSRSEASEYQASIPKEMKIVDVPKNLPAEKSAKTPDKPKAAEKPSAPNQPAASASPDNGKVRATVLNASGLPDAGDKVASALRSAGIEVGSVSSMATPYNNTVIVSYTTNNAVIAKLTGLPFKYALQVTKDDSKANQVTVVIGKDYAK